MADFRILIPRFYVDERVRSMPTDAKFLLQYLINGLPACSVTGTGIYEITRGEIAFQTDLDTARVGEILNFFNKERPMLAEYEEEQHIIFVKSFLKHNSLFLDTSAKIADAITKDFKKTGEKCPKFWAEFGRKQKRLIEKVLPELDPKKKGFIATTECLKEILHLEDLFFSLPSKKVEHVTAEKMKTDMKKIFKTP